MLMDRDLSLRNAAASDPRMDLLESLQVEHGVGPCISAFQEKTLVCSEDLAEDKRFGEFSSAAVEAGLQAVLASPIPYATDAVGVVAVFSGKPHAWTPGRGVGSHVLHQLGGLGHRDHHAERGAGTAR